MIVNHRSSRRFGVVLAWVAVTCVARSARAQQDTALAHPLTLGDAARLAARQSATALAARYRADEAAARAVQSRGALLPTLSANASGNGRSFNTATFGIPFPGLSPTGQVISGVNTMDLRGQASVDLIDFGAIGRLRSARSTALAGTADAENVAEQAAATAAAAYLNTQRADATLAARMADSVLADSLLSIAQEQLRAGVGVALDVTRAESQVASVRAQLIAARNERDRARLDLLRSLGLPLNAPPIQLADSLAEIPISDTLPNEQDAIARALRQRPDLRAAAAQLLAARQTISATRSERLPTISAFGDEGWIGINPSHLLNTYDWGVQLSLPLFDGLRREGRIEEQQAAARAIDVQLRDLRQQTAIQVRGALLDLASARQQVDAAREHLHLSQQELAQAQDRFRTGVAGNADVITASLDVNGSRTQVVDALAAYQSARVALAQAEGAVTSLP